MDFVNVALRIKPLDKNDVSNENPHSACLKIISKEPAIVLATDRLKTYDFDNIFTEDDDQKTVYQRCVKPLIKYVKEGYNCTVFAYGQSGTGKTYTMGTDPQVKDQDQLGLIPRTLNEFFEYNQNENLESEILLSFIEIYKEKVFDLLQNGKKQALLVKGLNVEGFRREKVFNLGEATHFLDMGNKNRHTAGTRQNAQSSRSHAIFTIYCKVKHSGHETYAKLNLVDLAGCESVKKTGNKGSTFDEGVNINKGLLYIGQVMTALADNSSYVPYRHSIITSILQDSLNKNNFVSLIACVSNCQEDTTETIQTLEFAARVKKVKSKPEVNKVVSQFKKENPVLFQNVRSCGTPFKRPQTPMKTPAKYPRTILMPLLSNAEQSIGSMASDQSSSLKSFGASTLSTLSEASDIQQTLSPVIQKYIGKMENSIMKMEDSLMKKMEESLVQKMEAIVKSTPYANWSTLQTEMRKMRTEIAQISTQSRKKVTSSPIGDRMSRAKKVLSYGTPTDNSPNSDNSKDLAANSFKVPDLPIGKKTDKVSARRTLSISPIEPDELRRSVRLSMKRIIEDCDAADITHDAKRRRVSSSTDVSSSSANSRLMTSKEEVSKTISNASVCHAPIRRSIRLALKKTVKESFEDDDPTLESSYLRIGYTSVLENTFKQKIQHTGKQTAPTRKRKNETSEDVNKNIALDVKATPAGTRLLKKQKNDSPYTAHTKEVFTKLTKGGQKDLEKLHYVGTKTAEHILSFRKLRGPIKKISDLKEIFGPKKFDIFVKKNFLKVELL
nr:unnamed protein product [Callosobruchus analis]